jgi:hypothetical protein
MLENYHLTTHSGTHALGVPPFGSGAATVPHKIATDVATALKVYRTLMPLKTEASNLNQVQRLFVATAWM